MADKISQHTHCRMCGKAIPVSETLCSEECRQTYMTRVKRSRILWYFMLGLIVAFTVVVILTNR
jgi:predicted nucleic acid-binding Zn ribbon protein